MFYRMEVSRIEQIEERQKWQHAYQSLALSMENRDSGVASGFSSPVSNPPSSRDSEFRDSGIRELSSGDCSTDLASQVRGKSHSLFSQYISLYITFY